MQMISSKAAARHQSARSGGTWSESRCVQRWRQRLSIVVQEGTSASVACMWARTVAVAGEPVPHLDGFTRVHLSPRGSEVQPPGLPSLPEPAAVPPGPHAGGGPCATTEMSEAGQLVPHSTAVTPQGRAGSPPPANNSIRFTAAPQAATHHSLVHTSYVTFTTCLALVRLGRTECKHMCYGTLGSAEASCWPALRASASLSSVPAARVHRWKVIFRERKI